MDDIVNIIYFILIIGAGISGLFNKSKKKKTVVHKPQKVNPWKDIKEELEEIREEFEQKESTQQTITLETEPVPSFDIPKGSSETISTDEPFSYDKKYNDVIFSKEKKYSKNKKSYFSDEIKADDIFQSDKLSTNDVIQFQDVEDVRKAIIYNEILNPKYI